MPKRDLSSVLDLEIISSLKALCEEDDGDDLLAELVQIFEESTPPLIDTMMKAALNNDLFVIQRIAHRLKGGSGNVGANAMSHLCSEIETQARDGAPLNYKTLIEQVDSEFHEALWHLQKQVSLPH